MGLWLLLILECTGVLCCNTTEYAFPTWTDLCRLSPSNLTRWKHGVCVYWYLSTPLQGLRESCSKKRHFRSTSEQKSEQKPFSFSFSFSFYPVRNNKFTKTENQLFSRTCVGRDFLGPAWRSAVGFMDFHNWFCTVDENEWHDFLMILRKTIMCKVRYCTTLAPIHPGWMLEDDGTPSVP